jgi:hypothetical protein
MEKGIIRKVVVGDLKSGMSYSVGQYFRDREVVSIEIDDSCFDVYGVAMVVISVADDKGTLEDWKRFPLSSCNLEYDLDDVV